jgi:dTDP-4-amino-4,6-dideoxygalactose transaminase
LKIPQIDLVRQYNGIKSEIDAAVGEVLSSGSFIMGKWVSEMEEAVAGHMGAGRGVGVASGTDALGLALMALDVGPGDEVITSPFSFVSVAEVALRMGARPVFADIDSRTFNIDPEDMAARITDRTKAIVPVHLYGQSADMDPIMEKAGSIPIVEDAAQAIGARYKDKPVGSFGSLTCLSFYPTKNLGAYGDGGMVISGDDALADRVAALRKHGQVEKYKYRFVGLNSRLDSIQAAILQVKFKRIEEWTEARRRVAAIYDRKLADLPVETPFVSEHSYHVYHQYTIETDRRDDLRAFLRDKGVGTATHYPLGLHLQEAYRDLGYSEGDLPATDKAAAGVISLPMFPELTDEEADYVCRSIREFFENA